MKLFSIIFILVNIFLLSSCHTDSKPTKKQINNVEFLSKQIEENPKQLNLYIQRAELFTKKKDLNKAIYDYQKAIEIAPDSSVYYLKLADLFIQLGQLKNTLAILNRATEIDPKNTNAWIKIGEINLMIKRYQKVFENANKALETNPYSDKAYFLKAYTYKESGDTNKAIDNFQKCLKNNPDNYQANIELGILFMKLKNPLAITYFNNAIAIDSLNIDAYYDLGLYYQENDMLNEAMATYKKIIKVNPNFPNSYYNIGYIYLELLNISDKAIPYFEKAILYKPNYYEAFFNLGLAYEKLGDVINAEKEYKESIKINPNYIKAIDALNRVQKNINQNNKINEK